MKGLNNIALIISDCLRLSYCRWSFFWLKESLFASKCNEFGGFCIGLLKRRLISLDYGLFLQVLAENEEGSASCITIKWGWFSGSDALTRQWATQILLARGRSLVTASGRVNQHAAAPLQPCRDEVYWVHQDIYIEDARIIARYHAF